MDSASNCVVPAEASVIKQHFSLHCILASCCGVNEEQMATIHDAIGAFKTNGLGLHLKQT